MFKPLVLIPSYNSGPLLERTVNAVLVHTDHPVLVVVDGSDDGSEQSVVNLEKNVERLSVLLKPMNAGKGAAVRTGLQLAVKDGFTHALVMDADGQHPATRIDDFFRRAATNPEAMILGQPVFGADVPLERLYGRKLSVWVVRIEILGKAIGDPLFGFRVYPIESLLRVMKRPGRSNRYDFDPEAAVRLFWMGTPAIQLNAEVEYISEEHGGITHFHYVRDNLRFIALHAQLLLEAPVHWIVKFFKSW